MLDPDILHKLVGVVAAVLVLLLTLPFLIFAQRRSKVSRGGYTQVTQLSGDNSASSDGPDNYLDRDGIATEDSIRAYSDTRPRIAVYLGTALGLGASIAVRVIVLKHAEDIDVLSDLPAWAELACWVRPNTLPCVNL